MIRTRSLAYLAFAAATLIWGANFVVVKTATTAWKGQEFAFLAARFWTALVIYTAILLTRRHSRRSLSRLTLDSGRHAALVGIVLAIGYASQTWYLSKGSAVNAAFITSTTVLWAPVFAFLFGKRVFTATWAGAILAIVGVLMIELPQWNQQTGVGDLLALMAAVAFAVELLLVSRFAPKMHIIQWTALGCFVVAVVMTLLAAATEDWRWPPEQTGPRLFAVLFTGIVATALALALQNWAQAQDSRGVKIIDGPRAAILAALEPVFTVLVSAFVLGDAMGANARTLGCLTILAGTLTSELAAARRTLLPSSVGVEHDIEVAR
jgi:drug/metabolite transporter (DMT)-like permease